MPNGVAEAYEALETADSVFSTDEETAADATEYYSDLLVANQTYWVGGDYTDENGDSQTATGVIPKEMDSSDSETDEETKIQTDSSTESYEQSDIQSSQTLWDNQTTAYSSDLSSITTVVSNLSSVQSTLASALVS